MRKEMGNHKNLIPEDFFKQVRKIFSPYPPCSICGEESETMFEPQPMRPDTWPEDLERQQIFDAKFPLGIHFCGGHSEKEISSWLAERGLH